MLGAFLFQKVWNTGIAELPNCPNLNRIEFEEFLT